MDSEVFSLVRSLSLESLAAAPWALDRSVLAELVSGAERGNFAALPRAAAEPRTQGVVAVLPIHGAIERRSSLLGELFGGSSIESLRAGLRAALADPDVRGIVLSIDSPGGTAAGVLELGAEIREARRTKPILAHVDTTAASAAYWLAAQANEVVVTPSGQVGSIGVYAIHQDISGALEGEGIRTSIISAGEHKVDGNEFEPLSDAARTEMQRRVDVIYDQFVSEVAKGRGTTAAAVLADYGKGRLLLASEALAAGMVDAVDTLDGALRRVARLARSHGLAAEADAPPAFASRLDDMVADAAVIETHVTARARLRAEEGRAALSTTQFARVRDAYDALGRVLALEPATGESPAGSPQVAAPEPPVVPAPKPATPRFAARTDFLDFLETH